MPYDYQKLGQLLLTGLQAGQEQAKERRKLAIEEAAEKRKLEQQEFFDKYISLDEDVEVSETTDSEGVRRRTVRKKRPKEIKEDRDALAEMNRRRGLGNIPAGVPSIAPPVQPPIQPPIQPQGVPTNQLQNFNISDFLRGGQPTGGLPPAVTATSPTGGLDIQVPNLPYEDQEKYVADIMKTKAQEDIRRESKLRETGLEKWNSEVADREIKFAVLTPKLNEYMELGGRAYQELRDVAKEYGFTLNFERGGLDALFNIASKNIAVKTKLAPLMLALDRLRPELGTELMRQLGAFRSGDMAKRFENTLAQFNGDIREDIANMTTTLVKNKANVVLLDENGNQLSDDEKNIKLNEFEANLIRKYNYMYRKMELMTKPYTAKRSFEWLAKNSSFSNAEQAIINDACFQHPDFTRTQVISKMIEKGVL